MIPRSPLEGVLRRHGWALAFGAVSVALVALHLAGLGTSPPGLYSDEASIGYNAWAVAHYGVDEHGASMPLYFQAFGEYKNPLYIYTLAPFTWVLPLTPAVVRLPAALFGLATCAFAALLAWQLTRMRRVVLLVLITAGIEPWLVQESRLGFEVISMVACMAAALWCLARAQEEDSARWYAGAGVALALSVFAYSTGRAFGVAMAVVLALTYGVQRGRARAWMWAVGPVLAATALLAGYIAVTPGLAGRFESIGIAYGDPSPLTLVGRFAGNYLAYWDVHFLFTHGDPNIRHSTGFGGMLLVSTLPAVVLGAGVCVRRFTCEPFPRLLVLGALAAPVPAALTAEGTPHSLRAALMLPFLLGFSVYGWRALARVLSVRPVGAATLAVLVCVESGAYFYDMFVAYPARAAAQATGFDAGELPAIERAAQLAGGHEVFLSASLDAPYIQALFALRPDPRAYAAQGLSLLHMRVEDPEDIADDAQPGDVEVLTPDDPLPPGAHVVDTETSTQSTGPPDVARPPTVTVPLVLVARS